MTAGFNCFGGLESHPTADLLIGVDMKKSLAIFAFCMTLLTACQTATVNKQIDTEKQAQTPIVRIFELVIAPEHLDEFNRLGKHNIVNSINLEQGVLGMYVLADKEMSNKLYVVEAYADDNAYQAHRQVPHFQTWFNGSKDMIISRKMIDTVPIVFGSKQVSPKFSGSLKSSK